MTSKDILRHVVVFAHRVTQAYIADLEDAELFVRSVPNANHIAWQLGHLLASNHHMLKALGYAGLNLPKGFEAAYTTESAASDDPANFSNKAEYLLLIDQAEAASLAAIDATPESRFDEPAPEPMRAHIPNVAAILAILGTHWLMHAGQFVPIRRKLGKKPLF
jgi:uncharacterized damage-inducible protein DinB